MSHAPEIEISETGWVFEKSVGVTPPKTKISENFLDDFLWVQDLPIRVKIQTEMTFDFFQLQSIIFWYCRFWRWNWQYLETLPKDWKSTWMIGAHQSFLCHQENLEIHNWIRRIFHAVLCNFNKRFNDSGLLIGLSFIQKHLNQCRSRLRVRDSPRTSEELKHSWC